MSAGMVYEAMNNAGALKSKLIVVLNDNDIPRHQLEFYKHYKTFIRKIVGFSLRETFKMIISSFSKGSAKKLSTRIY